MVLGCDILKSHLKKKGTLVVENLNLINLFQSYPFRLSTVLGNHHNCFFFIYKNQLLLVIYKSF